MWGLVVNMEIAGLGRLGFVEKVLAGDERFKAGYLLTWEIYEVAIETKANAKLDSNCISISPFTSQCGSGIQ